MSLIQDITRDRENGTPGPWTSDPMDGAHHPRVESEEKVIATCGNAEDWTAAKDEWEANAHRIANVPAMETAILEMHEAAKFLLSEIDAPNSRDSVLIAAGQVRAILAKIEGTGDAS